MTDRSIIRQTARLEKGCGRDMQLLLENARQDNAALRADIAALSTALDTLAAKLNADAGVTDTNYATNNAAAVTSGTPTFVA